MKIELTLGKECIWKIMEGMYLKNNLKRLQHFLEAQANCSVLSADTAIMSVSIRGHEESKSP